MSKAEDLSQNRYHTLAEKYAFIDGYEQAEKDLELSWEDIERIDNIILILNASIREESRYMDNQEFYREVLERFKERE